MKDNAIKAMHGIVRDKYTAITTTADGEGPPEFRVWLKVDHQSFCVSPFALDTKDEAEWMQEQLATALARFMVKTMDEIAKLS